MGTYRYSVFTVHYEKTTAETITIEVTGGGPEVAIAKAKRAVQTQGLRFDNFVPVWEKSVEIETEDSDDGKKDT